MSSDGRELSSPDLPRDSDRGSSVSSQLQDEYEELLQYAVVTPKYDPRTQVSVSSAAQAAEETAVRSEGQTERTPTGSDRSGRSSPDPVITVRREAVISEGNLNKMENLLDTWNNNLKNNVMMELRKWKEAFIEQHRLEIKQEQEKHAAHIAGINAEMDSLKELLNTYQTSNQRKDEVIVNLTRAVDKQRERLEMMRSFTRWRLQHAANREEVQGGRLAEQHYQLTLKRKAWAAWHSLIQQDWRERAERACRARAEEVCVQLSAQYEAKLEEHVEALQKAQEEIHRLHQDRDRYEDSMKKAFMRGVCALNIEALNMFQTGDLGRGEKDAAPSGEDPSSSRPLRPASSARRSPVVMDSVVHPAPSSSNTEETEAEHFVFQDPQASQAAHSTTLVNTALPPGGSTSSFRQASARTVTSAKQKASKTISTRVSGRPEHAKTGRPPGSINVIGVVPPMSSVIVERHHPVTQKRPGVPSPFSDDESHRAPSEAHRGSVYSIQVPSLGSAGSDCVQELLKPGPGSFLFCISLALTQGCGLT